MPNYAAAHVLTPAEFNQASPVGLIVSFAGGGAPDGWLECDGREISRSAYADLFSVIATTYGIGNGSTTFNLPNIADRFLLGKGTTFSVLGAAAGEVNHTLSLAELPVHAHTVSIGNAGAHNHSYTQILPAGPPYGVNLPGVDRNTSSGGATTGSVADHTHAVTLASAGSDQPHNNMPPYVVLTRIIRV